ncbi:hypothetical protein INR49_032558 [Caranx melampygus]|nr:hypothetical protein INR49_032558 [Caranx melampygus]
MADSEEFRLKRLKHEERLSRVFDEVMGLGDFAESSRGSATSSRSGGQDDTKGADEASGQEENQQVEEEDSNGSRQEEKMDEAAGESSFPRISSPSSGRPSSFNMRTNEGGGGGSGGAAFDNALDGLPMYGPEEEEDEEEDEDWHFALPMGSLEDVDVSKAKGKRSQTEEGNTNQGDPFAREPRGEEEEQEREGSVGSANTSHSSQDPTPDNSRDGGNLSQAEETEDSQQGERSEAAPVEDSNPPISPSINIKDEPIDEGYDAALLPQSSIRQIKEELEHQEEELRISSVYSVGGANTFASPTDLQLQSPVQYQLWHQEPYAHLNPLFLVVFGAVAALREILQPRDMITIPADDNTYMHFCGQFCLSVFRHKKKHTDKTPDKWPDKRLERKPDKLPEKPMERVPEKPFCSVCRVTNRQIEHEVTHQGRLHRLCSDACFVTWRKMRQLAMNCCEGCGLYCNSNSGSCQTLTIERSQLNFCGPTCIGTYKQTCRKTIECPYCHKMALVSTTIMERDHRGKIQLYCSPACVEHSRPPRHNLTGTAFPCSLCKVSAVPQYHLAMVDGTIRNFCSYECVSIFRKSGHPPQSDLTNGTSSLRDSSVKDASKPGPSVGASSVPPIPQDYPSSVPYQGHHPSHTSVPPLVPPCPAMSSPSVPGQAQARAPPGQPQKPTEDRHSDASKLTCYQCSKQFDTKPLLFSQQGRISMFCSKTCCEQYKTQKNVLAVCEYCKQEKIHFDTISYNQQDLNLCSESCKLLFKHDLTSRNKDQPWRPCTYCSGISQKMLHSHYGGRMEEFCRPHCMSQYTVLYYGMGRCDSCRKQGYMTEKLQCLGSVRNFCNMPCLLQYCYLHFETSQHISSNGTGTAPQTPYAPTQPHHLSKMNPVIADVVSLASGSATQPSVSADTALTGALPTSNIDGKNLDHASTQTDAMRVPVSRRRQMKNKSVLCRPFTMDQESMCQLPTPSAGEPSLCPVPCFELYHTRLIYKTAPELEAQALPSVSSSAGGENVRVVMVPVPVPVFIPVPMNMYSQHAPVPMTIPLPVPVPVLLPPQKTDMKDASVQSEPVTVNKDQPVSRADQRSSFREVTRSEAAASITHEDGGSQKSVLTDLPSTASSDMSTESVEPPLNAQPSIMTSSNPPTTSAEHQPPSSPMMDLETDLPPESLGQKPPPPQRGVKRPRDSVYSRKRGRRRTVSSERRAVVTPTSSKLNHLYGVKAWKSWVQQRNKQPRESILVDVKEDILQCDSAELSFALSRFIRDYLFMQGRIENIFTDELYSQFATEITGMLQLWKPKLLPSGDVVSSRVEESYLWECKQLGAYSPIVLLNTLLFFCTKTFHLTTLAQHQSLSFVNFTRRFKTCSRTGKVLYLHYQRSSSATPSQEDTERLRKRDSRAENKGDMEMLENVTNPLHCPVRLYEFYLSRCPESVKKRTDVFYLQPEQNFTLVHCSTFRGSHPTEHAHPHPGRQRGPAGAGNSLASDLSHHS